MSGYRSEIYIVDVTRGRLMDNDHDDEVTVQVHRNDGKWYEEEYTLLAVTSDVGDAGGIIEEDWEAMASIAWDLRKRLKKE